MDLLGSTGNPAGVRLNVTFTCFDEFREFGRNVAACSPKPDLKLRKWSSRKKVWEIIGRRNRHYKYSLTKTKVRKLHDHRTDFAFPKSKGPLRNKVMSECYSYLITVNPRILEV